MSVYIDNIQIFRSKRSKEISKLKKKLYRRFVITDLGPYVGYLDIEI